MRVEHIHEDGKLVGWREWHRVDRTMRQKNASDRWFRNLLADICDNRAIETGADNRGLTFNIINRDNVEAGFYFAIPDGVRVYVPDELL